MVEGYPQTTQPDLIILGIPKACIHLQIVERLSWRNVLLQGLGQAPETGPSCFKVASLKK